MSQLFARLQQEEIFEIFVGRLADWHYNAGRKLHIPALNEATKMESWAGTAQSV
jgi:hypothetical protein